MGGGSLITLSSNQYITLHELFRGFNVADLMRVSEYASILSPLFPVSQGARDYECTVPNTLNAGGISQFSVLAPNNGTLLLNDGPCSTA